MDGGPYPAYRDLAGTHLLNGLTLDILRVQPDPFAGPSRVRLVIPYASTGLEPAVAELPGGRGTLVAGLADTKTARALALRDFLGRWIGSWLESRQRGPREIRCDTRGQEVLDHSSVLLRRDHLELRLEIDLPARGRRILGREAGRLLIEMPERLLAESLSRSSLDFRGLSHHIDAVEDFARLQEILDERGWISFVADGSCLARRAGNDDRPLNVEPVVPFLSPPELRREVTLPHAGRIEGMALEPGVTLLCGGGFHGKSTLLRAIAASVMPHVPGDGRERVATRGDAQSVRAEDGRAVSQVDLHPFLHDLPFGRSTEEFSTGNASGSTSQAASIMESLQGGSRLLMMDEDTSATNFMIRDGMMERLLSAHQEPITPFLERAQTLFQGLGVSSILVIGGSGEYFRVADRVLLLDTFRPLERTAQARRIAEDRPAPPPSGAVVEEFRHAADPARVLPLRGALRAGGGCGFRGRGGPRIKAVSPRRLLVERTSLDLGGCESLRGMAQARFLGRVLTWALREQAGRSQSIDPMGATVARLEEAFLEEWRSAGLDGFDREPGGDLAAVRFLDVLAAVNRLRVDRVEGAAPAREGRGEADEGEQ
jgi:predicted ABC-class ATPase